MERIITLITDFGLKDNYVGVMKGVIVQISPKTRIIDITHGLTKHDVLEASYILKCSYKYFPKQTIHLVVVDPGVGSSRQGIIVESKDGYYFVSPDNGVLSYISPSKIIRIEDERFFLHPVSNTFHGRDIFSPVAAHIANGTSILEFGPEIKEMVKLQEIVPDVSPKAIVGEVIYIDHFGNLITNIAKEGFPWENVTIEVKGSRIKRISQSYAENQDRELLAIFGSGGHLEVSVNKGSAKDFLQAKKGDKVIVRVKR
ncbi:MAG: SAM-dependent chlorinase/fluorinase [bacterium]|nr:SAM-dependent chlorinase/fluorinase [bacterium]